VGVELGLYDRVQVIALCRVGRLAHDQNHFSQALGGLDPVVEYNLPMLINLLGHPERLNALRAGLVMPRERVLTPEQLEGNKILDSMLRRKGELLRQFSNEEEALMRQLRNLRAQRDGFLTGCNRVAQLTDYQNAGRRRLTQIQREQYTRRWEEERENRGFGPLANYLEEVRVVLNSAEQRRILLQFRELGGENAAVRRIDAAYNEGRGLFAAAEEAHPPDDGSVDDGLLGELGL